MPFKIKDAGNVLRTVSKMKAKDGSALRNIIRVKVLDGATLRTVATFAGPLSLTANNVFNGGFVGQSFIGSSTAVPSGGLAPYSYVWAKLAGADLITSITTSAKAGFSSGVMSTPGSVTAAYRCTCTDSSGQTATADISVTFQAFPTPS